LAATHSSLNLENITGRPASPTMAGGSFASLPPGSPPGRLTPSSSYVFNGDPLTSAKAKLTKYSLSFDPLEPNNQSVISGFHGQRLTRESFSLLIRQGLHIALSSNEVDALYIIIMIINIIIIIILIIIIIIIIIVNIITIIILIS
jgi:type IV secretory pathway VirB6-like protein